MESFLVVGYEQLTVDNTSGGKALASITAPSATTKVPGANYAIARVSTADIRWRADAGTLDASTGQPQYATEEFELLGPLQSYKFIRTGSTSATLDVTYYRREAA